MKTKYKIFMFMYFIVIGIVLLTCDDLSVVATKLEYVQCGSANGIPRAVPHLTTIAYTLLMVGTPLVLIVFSIIELVKSIMGGNEDDITKARRKLFKKFIAAAIVFIIASLVQFVLLRVSTNDSDRNSVSSCLKCFLYYSSSNCQFTEDSGNNVYKGGYKHEQYSNIAEPPTNPPNSNSNSNSNSNTTSAASKTIFIGDSRTVGMCMSTNNEVNGDYCRDQNHQVVAKVGAGYSWYSTTGISNANSILNKDTTIKYNIVILMGVNDIGGNVDTASTNYINSLKTYSTGGWKNHNIVFVSVLPVSSSNNYNLSQTNINTFNTKMKDGISNMNKSNVKYCDITSQFSGTDIYEPDGLHYRVATYMNMYNNVSSTCK